MEEAENNRLALQTLMAKHGVSPFTTMATAFISLPVWISFFFALRRCVGGGQGLGMYVYVLEGGLGGGGWIVFTTMATAFISFPVWISFFSALRR
jgi:membrane protein insertase Oxa1/YidC/SpoIIIJ